MDTLIKQQPTAVSPPPPSYIQPTTPFSPHSHQCCQCNQTTTTQAQTQNQHHDEQETECPCKHRTCPSCPRLDTRGISLIPHAFPAAWVCSTCSTPHSVLSILTARVACACGQPSLQAVYDQFGRLFLFWRDDPAVYDLRDPAKCQEAAWRVWEAGGEPWLGDVLAFEAGEAAAAAESLAGKGGEEVVVVELEMERGGKKGWSRYSQSSLSSEESLDIEIEMDGV